MSLYYLIPQLPSLDGIGDGVPLPITEERFISLCVEHIGRRATERLYKLTLTPPKEQEKTGSKLIDAWFSDERQLRLALCRFRAAKLNKSDDARAIHLPHDLLQTARTAVEMDDPLEAEKYLNHHRLAHLESLRPTDAFSEDALLYYGLKLKLLQRIRGFDEARGMTAYRTIYDSIMRGGEAEAKQ